MYTIDTARFADSGDEVDPNALNTSCAQDQDRHYETTRVFGLEFS